MKEKAKRNESGITLIALVVTIVILIILAVISVNAVIGENGLIAKAEQAKKIHENAVKYEEEQLSKIEQELIQNIPAGEEVAKPSKWTSEKVKAITDGNGNVIPLPEGFYYVGGNCNDGLVISDEKADENKGTSHEVAKTLVGNQFVWIPVDGETVKYEQDKTHNGEDDKENEYYHSESDKTIIYDDWTDEGGNSESVAKYGGFYIARYEAGIPETASFYPTESNNMNYTFGTQKNTTSIIPVSKRGISWSYISQTNAEAVSNNMYQDSTSVTSRLVDSYAWDTVCNYIGKDQSDKAGYLRNSTSYGNFYDSTGTIKDTIYAVHTYDNGWTKAASYERGNVTQPNATGTNRVEIETGASESYKTKNIYDLAGNMYEWTTEKGKHNNSADTYAVLRGGSFNDAGSKGSVMFRFGRHTVDHLSLLMGFRVVLYINV